MKLKLVALVVLVAVGAGALAVAFGAIRTGAASSTQYLTATAVVGDLTDDVAATGTLEASTSYGLVFGADPYLIGDTDTAPTTDATWPVTEVTAKVGDAVAAGDVLATGDPSSMERDLENATGDWRSAKINLAIAQEALDTAEADADTNAIRQAKLGLYNAQKQLSQTAAARDTIVRHIKLATLKSPIAGIVTALNIAPGFDAPAGAAIVIAATTYQVTTDVVESDLAAIEVGQTAAVSIGAVNAELQGTVTAISPVASDSTTGVVAYPVTVTITDAPATARAGMSADVTITTASATGVLTVPASALQGTTGAYAVLTLGADGTPQRVPVEVGLVTSTAAEITSGLTEGTVVVTGTAAARQGTTTVTPGGGLGGGGLGIPGGGGGPRNPGGGGNGN